VVVEADLAQLTYYLFGSQGITGEEFRKNCRFLEQCFRLKFFGLRPKTPSSASFFREIFIHLPMNARAALIGQRGVAEVEDCVLLVKSGSWQTSRITLKASQQRTALKVEFFEGNSLNNSSRGNLSLLLLPVFFPMTQYWHWIKFLGPIWRKKI
jgi:hypothetical protein